MKTILSVVAGGRKPFALFLLLLGMVSTGFAQQYLPVAPVVRITSPANHTVFHAPVDIPIFAYAGRIISDLNSDGVGITNVEFYASNYDGTITDLGRGFNLGRASGLPSTPPFANFVIESSISRLAYIYCLVWTNVSPGGYALTAVAKGSGGLSRTSAPVNITVLVPPPATSAPDVLSVIATDPIAIAGTNMCVWPGLTNATPAWTNWPPPVPVSFTNWGPRNAVFTVCRFGDVTSNLLVNYSLGGTASNGVDYVTLPGSVTLAAGAAYALIPVIPIDNGPPYTPKSVILTLTPDTNTPPDYLLGIPRCAEALILEDWPRPLPFLLPDGTFHVNAAGPDGAWFYVQYSTDFVNWSTICTNQVFQGSIDFVDPDAPANSARFYRSVPLANPPSD